MLGTPRLDAGWFWDLGNGIGFAAIAGVLYLATTSARPLHVTAHRNLGVVVLVVAALHALWFLAGDATVVHYVRLGAPAHMWAGVISFALLAVVTFHGLPETRKRLHSSYDEFRNWHRWLGIGVIAFSAWHILGARFYLSAWWQIAMFLLLCVAASYLPRTGKFNLALSTRATNELIVASCVGTVLFAAIRNLVA